MSFVMVYAISMVVGFYLSIILHELGHLVCGRLSGYGFVSFRLLNLLWAKDDAGRVRLTKSAGLGGMLGQCLMEPLAEEPAFRFVLYNMGGGVFNLLTGAAAFCVFFFAKNQLVEAVFLAWGAISLYFGAFNLIPQTLGAIPNDGKNIQEAHKSADAKHGLYMLFKVNAEMSRGKRLQDYPPNSFAMPKGADTNNYFVANMLLFHASQLEEQGAYKESYQAFLRLESARLPVFYSSQVILALMFQELVFFGDEASVARARGRVEEKGKDKLFQNMLKMKHPAFLPFAAAKAAFLDADAGKAQALIQEARTLNLFQKNFGQEHSVTLMLDRLERAMENGGSNQG